MARYGLRHLIKNFFGKLKQFRAIARVTTRLRGIFSPQATLSPRSFGSIDHTT
jgi:hypothetical protein